jgi:hypothetical protein
MTTDAKEPQLFTQWKADTSPEIQTRSATRAYVMRKVCELTEGMVRAMVKVMQADRVAAEKRVDALEARVAALDGKKAIKPASQQKVGDTLREGGILYRCVGAGRWRAVDEGEQR